MLFCEEALQCGGLVLGEGRWFSQAQEDGREAAGVDIKASPSTLHVFIK